MDVKMLLIARYTQNAWGRVNDMAYSDTKCSSCGRELRTRNPNSDTHMCSACWDASKRGEPSVRQMKLKEAIRLAKATIGRKTKHERRIEQLSGRKHTPTPRNGES